MTPRIFIAIACHNRRAVAEQCLPTIRDSVREEDLLGLYNDGSMEYDSQWLAQFGQPGMMTPLRSDYPALGIQAQRRMHLKDFLQSDCTHLYLTDHDVFHDPTWRENGLRLLEKYHELPVCLYNTQAHVRIPGNTVVDDPAREVIVRRVAPGVSYLLTGAHVEHLAPHIGSLQHFDWQLPALLGGFAVSRVGYCDHIGWGGERHPPHEGLDGGDRVLAPTEWLVAKRAEIVAALSHA